MQHEKHESIMYMSEAEITAAVAAGVKLGFTQAMDDPDVVEKFWQGGYEQLTGHASKASSQWVGKRILTAAVTALLVWGLTYLVKNGVIK